MILKMNVILTLITVLIANDFCFGQNYGTVSGPTSYDAKIIIAGGGIPGITMARELAMSNFTNVTVYEGSPLIGSKFGSTERRGTTFHNMWQIPISDDSEIMELAQQYLPESDIIKEPQPVILAYEEDMSNYKESSIADYLIAYTMKMNVDINRVDAINHFVDDTLRYKRFHENVLQVSADGAYMEPTDQTLSSLQQTVSEFLTEYSIESLKPVFLLQMTLQGSGHPDDTPLLYGLKEVTPKVMDMYGDLINSTDESETSHDFNSYMLKNGYVGLFNEIIENHNIKVVKNTAVDRLRQQSSFSNTKNQVRLRQMMQGYFEYKYEDADFVVWAENLRSSIMARSFNNQRDYSLKEYNAFLQPKMEIYIHHNLIEMTNITRASSPIMIFIDELMNKGNGVAMLYDTYAVLNMVSKDSYTTGDYSKNADQSNYTTYQSIHITYDYGIVSSYDNLNRLNPQELTEVENMKFKTEGLFSKRSISDGISWNLRDLQGANGMWFVDETMQKTSPTRRNNLNKVLLQNLQPIITESEVSSLIPTSSFSYVTTFVSKSFDVVSSTVQAFTTASFHSMSSMRISSSLKIEPTGTISSMDMKSTGKMSSMLDSTHSMKVVPTHMMSSMDMKSSETMSIMIGSTHSMKVRSTHTMSSMDMKSSETMSRMLDSTHSMKVEPTHMMSSMDMKSSETMSSMLDGTHSMKVEPTNMMSSMDMKSSETMSSMLDVTYSMKVESTHMMSSMDMKSSETMSRMLDATYSMNVEPTHMMSSMDMKSYETLSSMLDASPSINVEATHMMSSMGDEPQSSHMSELGVVDATNVMPSMLINTVTGSEHLQMTKSLRSAPTMSVMFSEVLHSHHQTTESQRSSNTPILAAR